MNTSDSNRAKFKFNIIDIIMMVIILGAIGTLAYLFFASDATAFDANNKVTVEYTVELRTQREEFRDFIKEGDRVVDTVTLYSIGEVVGVEYAPTVYIGVNRTDGTLVYSEYPERINITVKIRAQADAGDNFYSINGYDISVGKATAMRVPMFTGEGYCTTIREVDANE